MLLFLTANAAYTDRIDLSDGSVINGEVLRIVDGKVTVKTTFAGEISFSLSDVSRIVTEQAKPVHLNDGSIIRGTIEMKEPSKIELTRKEGEAGIVIDATEVTSLNPPPPEKPKWKGQIVGNLAIASGNSETKGIGVSADMTKRTDDDRINLRAGYYYSEDNGRGSRDDQLIFGKYDYFFNKQLFGYLTSRLDRDVIRDLELRTTGGAGLGYQFLEDPIYNLFGEMGLSYVNEDFSQDADDQNYVAGRAALHYGWWILKERLEFTEDIEIFLGIEDIDDWFAISESGLSWKVNKRWSANASIRYEYDNTPATNFERSDTKYLLGIGYSF